MHKLNALSAESVQSINECLRAASEGPFFPDWEFQTLFGIERDIVKAVYNYWPEQTVDDDDFESAIIGSLGHLLGYPHGHWNVWNEYVSVPPDCLKVILEEIKSLGL
jgi:hypothetical protein